MTKQEAAIVAAYTGYLLGEFSDMHEYVEKIMGRPVFTHELGNKEVADQIKVMATADFIALEVVK